ncbi:MAG: FAD-dependent monooxygenase [Lysobacterales bacterium]
MHDIAIAGGGIGGLTTALGLLKAGHNVRVFEQSDNPAESGAGLSIAPNAAAVLNALGLRERLLAISDLPERGCVYDGRTGEELSVTPYGEVVREHFGDYYFQTPRASIYRLLADEIRQLDPHCLRTGYRFESFEQTPDNVTLTFSDKPAEQAQVLIGADGLKSNTRACIHGDLPARFTRYIAWRALIPMARLDVSFREPVSRVWIGQERNFVFYPLDGGRLLNCVMFAGDSDWTDEGWRQKASVREIRQAYKGFHDTVQTVIDALPEDGCYKWAMFDREPLADWQSGRVALLGDAAHPMLPFLGQGASMALEDAAEMIHALNQHSDVAEALSAYGEARVERANWVLLESRASGARFASPKPSASLFSNDQAMQTGRLFGWRPPALV